MARIGSDSSARFCSLQRLRLILKPRFSGSIFSAGVLSLAWVVPVPPFVKVDRPSTWTAFSPSLIYGRSHLL
jgi:hypothetical protein